MVIAFGIQLVVLTKLMKRQGNLRLTFEALRLYLIERRQKLFNLKSHKGNKPYILEERMGLLRFKEPEPS